MDKKICEEKVAELISQIEAIVRIRAMDLYSSGGINVDLYDDESYRLPRILATAAIKHATFVVNPIKKEDRRMVKNLSNF